MVAFSDITLFLTHVSRNAHPALTQPVAALKVRSGHVTYSPTALVKSDVEQRVLKPCSPMTIAPLIRAFRAQLALTAPELVLRKWTMFCAFEGTRIGGPCGKRTIPMFQIRLPSEITSATPQMTPAPTQEYDHRDDDEGSGTNNTFSKNEVLSDTDAPQTLESLLAPLMPRAELDLFTWSARFSFVVGEDEEEERKRREELKAAAVTFSANKCVNAVEFTARDEVVLEARLSCYPLAMREQMRNVVRQEIIDEKNGNRFGAPPPQPQFGGGLFSGGGFGFASGNGVSAGLFGQQAAPGALSAFGSGGGAKKAAVPAAGLKMAVARAGGLLSNPQQQRTVPDKWAIGASLQQSSNTFSLSPNFGNSIF